MKSPGGPLSLATNRPGSFVQQVVTAVLILGAAILIFISIWLTIRIRRTKSRSQDEENATERPAEESRNRKRSELNVESEPLIASNTLANSFSVEPESSYAAIFHDLTLASAIRCEQVHETPAASIPDIHDSRQEDDVDLLRTSSTGKEDLATPSIELEDPFLSNGAESNTKARSGPIEELSGAMTPGVSPSTYPLRDRISHDWGRRRNAIESVDRDDGTFSLTEVRGSSERHSIGEQELQQLRRAYDLGLTKSREQDQAARGLRRGRSADNVVGQVDVES